MNATPFITFATLALGVIAVEAMLWYAFRAKATPISFPHDTDASSLRFFTLARLRLFALMHTVFLVAGTLTLFFILW